VEANLVPSADPELPEPAKRVTKYESESVTILKIVKNREGDNNNDNNSGSSEP
jgi:hypothetical protein